MCDIVSDVKIKTLVVNQLQENCYVIESSPQDILVVDPGQDTKEEREHLFSVIGEGKAITVLCTHGHPDHIFALSALLHRPRTTAYIGASDKIWLDNASSFAAQLNVNVDTDFEGIKHLNGGETLTVGDITIDVLHTPGHSAGGMCFYLRHVGLVFTGDTLFRECVGRTDLLNGDYAALQTHIREQLYTLPDETIVCPGHGQTTTIGYEKSNNPYVTAL